MPPSEQQPPRLTAGFDANLEFPFADPAWQAFSRSSNCTVTRYLDLDELTTALVDQLFGFSYLPSANCFFLQKAPYLGLASALTSKTRRPVQNSVFIVSKKSTATSWQELQGKRLGYINTYCTTSYFAPAILLSRSGYRLTQFFDAVPVAPWQGQIDAVVSGAIDATMVYEDVWLSTPSNAQNTKVIARMDGLPTPPVIVHNSIDPGTRASLKAALLDIKCDSGPELYAGFTGYQDTSMQQFFADLSALPGIADAA